MAREAAYLDKAIARYSEEVAATAHAGLTKLRARFPGARLMVYERRQSLPIGFAPAERGAAVFSLVLYPRWVRLFFLEGAAILDDPYIRGLMAQALKIAGADLKTGRGQVVLKSKITA